MWQSRTACHTELTYVIVCNYGLPWRRGKVVIASVHRTEDPGLESRQGVSFFRNLYIAVQLS
jgi:hypothetical protein